MVAATAPWWPAVTFEERTWVPNPANRGPRADRLLGAYRSAVPPRIAELPVSMSIATEAAVRAAEEAAKALRSSRGVAVGPLAGALLRSESVASSKIENLSARQEEVALAAFGVPPRAPGSSRAVAARAVAANIAAMTRALERGDPSQPVDLDDLLDVHRVLMADDARSGAEAGRLREQQNWIGGSDYSPRDALFVPPDPRRLPGGMADLVGFVRRADLSPIAVAAIAHAQFETLHPFVDGNGRTGRALVHLIWRHRGLTQLAAIPVSTVLLADVDAYFAGLGAFREGDLDSWLAQFAVATTRAAVAGRELVEGIAALRDSWRAEVRARSDSTAARMLDVLPNHPVLDIHALDRIVGGERVSLYRGIDRLAAAGVVQEVTGFGRNRVWFAPDLFELLEEFERELGERRAPRARHSR